MKLKIDFNVINEFEGYSLAGYVPDAGNSESGVTIASGFDLGQRSVMEICDAFDQDLADKLAPFAGIKGAEAVAKLDKENLIITNDDAGTINWFAHREATSLLVQRWNECAVIPFDALNSAQQTVLASVAFQYGSMAHKCPNFWRQTTSGDWGAAIKNLRNFGDRYPTRRNKEADILEG